MIQFLTYHRARLPAATWQWSLHLRNDVHPMKVTHHCTWPAWLIEAQQHPAARTAKQGSTVWLQATYEKESRGAWG